VQHRDARLRAQASERGFELQRLVDSLLHEQLDRLFAPGSERAATKPAGESLDARKSDALDFGGLAVENRHACIDEDLTDLVLLSAFVVVVPEHGNDWNLHRRAELASENARFVRQPVIGKVATQHQNIGVVADLREHLLELTL
jgi:hypothetical protein